MFDLRALFGDGLSIPYNLEIENNPSFLSFEDIKSIILANFRWKYGPIIIHSN